MGIKYSDSEVNVFHPLCEKALTAALQKLNLQKKYRVIHHQYTGSLEMDFCIQNQATKKYLCVIEVKRTPSKRCLMFRAMKEIMKNRSKSYHYSTMMLKLFLIATIYMVQESNLISAYKPMTEMIIVQCTLSFDLIEKYVVVGIKGGKYE